LHKLELPQNIDIPADGEYRIVAKKSGFATFEKKVQFTADSPELTVVIALDEEGESAKEEAPTERASSPPTSSRSSRSTASAASSSSPPAAASASGQGTLNINSSPISSVILDGRPLGQTPKIGIKVKPGTHTVVFVHPQHGRKAQTVTVASGQTAVAVARF
jgi:PEGA domain